MVDEYGQHCCRHRLWPAPLSCLLVGAQLYWLGQYRTDAVHCWRRHAANLDCAAPAFAAAGDAAAAADQQYGQLVAS